MLRKIETVQGQSVDSLTGAVGKEKSLPTWDNVRRLTRGVLKAEVRTLESEEDEESKVVHTLCGVGNVVEETEVIIRSYTAVSVSWK